VAERRGEPTLADAGRPAQDQALVRIDPGTLGELLEQGAVEAAYCAVVDVFDGGLMAQPGIAQAGMQPPVASVAGLLVEQQSEPFRMGQRRGLTGCFDLAESLRHTGKSELMKQIECGMGEHSLVSYW
jgi:hypothetical protein